jgi:methylmalonyl-CoA carboxyltransferase large subunit
VETIQQETKQKSTMSESGSELRATLQEVLAQLANLAERVAGLEELASMGGAESPAPIVHRAAAPVLEPPPAQPSLAVEAGISEEEVLAISAALAAWLGVHAHIRQIRLIRTGAWAQQGRVTIQASHRLNY